jgi:hypothetical protein
MDQKPRVIEPGAQLRNSDIYVVIDLAGSNIVERAKKADAKPNLSLSLDCSHCGSVLRQVSSCDHLSYDYHGRLNIRRTPILS